MTKETFLKNLTSFLLSCFSADEFRRFVRYGNKGDDLEKLLHGPIASPALIIGDGVKMLYEHDVINDEFFERLIAERPRRKYEVEKLRNEQPNNSLIKD